MIQNKTMRAQKKKKKIAALPPRDIIRQQQLHIYETQKGDTYMYYMYFAGSMKHRYQK